MSRIPKQEPHGDLLARIYCRHGNAFAIYDICEVEEQAPQPSRKDRKKFKQSMKSLKRLLREN